jgi:hypothetical protein
MRIFISRTNLVVALCPSDFLAEGIMGSVVGGMLRVSMLAQSASLGVRGKYLAGCMALP